MMSLFLRLIHFVVLILKLLKPSGLKAIAIENLSIRIQLLLANKNTDLSLPLTTLDRILGMIIIIKLQMNSYRLQR